MNRWLVRVAVVVSTALLMFVFAFAVHFAYMECFSRERRAVALPASAVTAPLSLRDAEASIVEASASVMPAVISVQTKQRFTIPGLQHPFADDPFFRQFFGRPRPPREGINRGLGSGVIIDSSGIAITNNHVIDGADEITVKLGDGRELPAELVGTDPRLDIAVLRIKGEGPFPEARLGNSDHLRVGMIVLAMGTPFDGNLSQTVTMGIVSALSRSGLRLEAQENFIQTDAAINMGNSGGPLVNLNGEVIGINVAIITGGSRGSDGIGFAIPANAARYSVESILTHGKVVRGYLGVAIQDLDDDLRRNLGLASNRGALITEVVEDGPAERAGLKSGDVITQWNGVEVTTSTSLTDVVSRTQVGSSVPVTYVREGKTASVRVTVAERPAGIDRPEGSARTERPSSNMAPTGASARLGMTVRWVEGDEARRLNLPARGVVLVTEVKEGSEAAKRGVVAQSGILEADGVKLPSVAVLEEILARDGAHRLLIRAFGANRYIVLQP